MIGANSPADVLRTSLITAGVGSLPANEIDWPIFVGHLPDLPDAALCVYNTAGTRDGRVHSSGESIRHPGWQVRVRALGHSVAFERMGLVAEHLDTIHRELITIDSVVYRLDAVTQTSDILSLGQEPDGRRRDGFSLNGILTYTAT